MGNTQAAGESKGSLPRLPKQNLVKGRSFMKFGKKKQLLVDHDGTSTMAIECSSKSDVDADNEDGFSHILIEHGSAATTKPIVTSSAAASTTSQGQQLSKSADSLLTEGAISRREYEFIASHENEEKFAKCDGGAHESQRNGNDDNSPITKKPLDTDSDHDAITAIHDRQSIASLPATRNGDGPAATMTTSSTIATSDNNNKAQQKHLKTDSASESVTSFRTINTTNHPTALAQPPSSRSTKAPQTQPIAQPTGNNKLPASSAAIATKPNPNSLSSKLVLGEGTTNQLDRCTYGPPSGSIVLTTDSWKRANSVSENIASYGNSSDLIKVLKETLKEIA